jgi:hypothetical protein
MSNGLATIRNGEVIDAEIVQASPVATPSVLAPIIRAEMDAAILMARQYPRSITQFLDRAMSFATLNYETARQCCYAVPRGGKTVKGPSVRLAEIVASTFGNIRVDARIIEERERYVVAQAVAQDLEINNTWRSEVRRSIWSNGNPEKRIPPGRFNDDMINVTCNAAISIASRNVIFRVVPRAIYSQIYLACQDIVDKGDTSKSLTAERSEWLSFLREEGFKDREVFEVLGVVGLDDIGYEHLSTLKGFDTAIQDGETTWEAIFRPKAPETAAVAEGGPAPSKSARLAERLGKDKGAAKPKADTKPESKAEDGWELGRE